MHHIQFSILIKDVVFKGVWEAQMEAFFNIYLRVVDTDAPSYAKITKSLQNAEKKTKYAL